MKRLEILRKLILFIFNVIKFFIFDVEIFESTFYHDVDRNTQCIYPRLNCVVNLISRVTLRMHWYFELEGHLLTKKLSYISTAEV
mgnify:CR=1 FL=1